MKKFIPILLAVLLLGCTSWKSQQEKLQKRYEKFDQELLVSASSFSQAAEDSLLLVPKEHRTREVELATDFVGMANVYLPDVPFDLRINVPHLVSTNENLARKAMALLEKRYNEDARKYKEMENVKTRLGVAEKKLQDYGEIYEKEKNSSIIKRIWAWGIGAFGLAGFIALIIFCPAIIPVLIAMVNMIISGIASIMPSVVNVFRVVGVNTFKRVVKGLVAAQPDDKTFTKKEVQTLIDTELEIATDEGDKAIIKNARKKVNV